MYTVPVKVTVQARTLIDAFEKGELKTLSTLAEEEDEQPVKPVHPELYEDELAEPGTARKLLLAFEVKRQQTLRSSPTTSAAEFSRDSRRLSVSRYVGFEESSQLEKRRIAKALLLKGNGLAAQGQGVEVKVEQVNGLSGGTSGTIDSIEINGDTVVLVSDSIPKHDGQNSDFNEHEALSVNEHKIEVLPEEDLLQKVDQKISERVDEKVVDKLEEKIEAKAAEAIELKTEENVETKVLESSAEVSKSVTEVTVVVTETVDTAVTHSESVSEAAVEAINNSTEEHKGEVTESISGGFQDGTDRPIVENLQVKVEEKLEDRLKERVEEKVEEKIDEKVIELVVENKDHVRTDDEVKQGPVVEIEEKVEARILTEANADLQADIALVEITDDVKDDLAERNVQELHRRNLLLISAVKPENDLDIALREVTKKVLEASGHSLDVEDVFHSTSLDYEEERRKLVGADLLVFHYRPILNSPPALLKSWLEGALIQADGTPVDKSALQGKKAVLLVTCADGAVDEDTAEELPFISSIQDSVLRSYDMDIFKPYIIVHAVSELTEDFKAAKVEEWSKRLSAFMEL